MYLSTRPRDKYLSLHTAGASLKLDQEWVASVVTMLPEINDRNKIARISIDSATGNWSFLQTSISLIWSSQQPLSPASSGKSVSSLPACVTLCVHRRNPLSRKPRSRRMACTQMNPLRSPARET